MKKIILNPNYENDPTYLTVLNMSKSQGEWHTENFFIAGTSCLTSIYTT